MICPGCKGNKQACHQIDVPGGTDIYCGYKCSRCAGMGEVTPELDRAWAAGHAARDARIARKETVRAAASRLGMTVAALCDFENGRVDVSQQRSRSEASTA